MLVCGILSFIRSDNLSCCNLCNVQRSRMNLKNLISQTQTV